MKLTEKERLLLVSKKEEILKLTNQIIENIHNIPDVVLLKKNINSILAQISIIASYTDSKSHKLTEFNKITLRLFNDLGRFMDEDKWDLVRPTIILWCNFVNEIQFNLTERKALINFPKIDLNLFKV